MKIRSALPPLSPKPKIPPPLKRGLLWTWRFSCRKKTEILGAHKIGAAISGPRIADKNFTDTRNFLMFSQTDSRIGLCLVWFAGTTPEFCLFWVCGPLLWVARGHQCYWHHKHYWTEKVLCELGARLPLTGVNIPKIGKRGFQSQKPHFPPQKRVFRVKQSPIFPVGIFLLKAPFPGVAGNFLFWLWNQFFLILEILTPVRGKRVPNLRTTCCNLLLDNYRENFQAN